MIANLISFAVAAVARDRGVFAFWAWLRRGASPFLAAASRTAQVRVDLANREGQIRLGMYVEMQVAGVAATALAVPRGAVQFVGSRSVVYIGNQGLTGRVTERAVVVGQIW